MNGEGGLIHHLLTPSVPCKMKRSSKDGATCQVSSFLLRSLEVTDRMTSCGHFISLIFGDYVTGFLELPREGNMWSMNPFDVCLLIC